MIRPLNCLSALLHVVMQMRLVTPAVVDSVPLKSFRPPLFVSVQNNNWKVGAVV